MEELRESLLARENCSGMGEMVEDRTNGGDCNLKMWEMGQAGIWGAAQELEKKDRELTRGVEGLY